MIVTGHVGPFARYPNCNFIVTINSDTRGRATCAARDASQTSDAGLLDALFDDLARHHRAILLFRDWVTFHRWLGALHRQLHRRPTAKKTRRYMRMCGNVEV